MTTPADQTNTEAPRPTSKSKRAVLGNAFGAQYMTDPFGRSRKYMNSTDEFFDETFDRAKAVNADFTGLFKPGGAQKDGQQVAANDFETPDSTADAIEGRFMRRARAAGLKLLKYTGRTSRGAGMADPRSGERLAILTALTSGGSYYDLVFFDNSAKDIETVAMYQELAPSGTKLGVEPDMGRMRGVPTVSAWCWHGGGWHKNAPARQQSGIPLDWVVIDGRASATGGPGGPAEEKMVAGAMPLSALEPVLRLGYGVITLNSQYDRVVAEALKIYNEGGDLTSLKLD